jgi:hypothetical protein
MSIGMAGGVGLFILLAHLFGGGPGRTASGGTDSRAWWVTAAVFAALGGLAGGFLTRRSWALFAGGIIGAIVTGGCGVVATHHLKGLIYSIFGGPLGAFCVYFYAVDPEVAKPSGKTSAPRASVGVWDSDLDR